MHRWGCVAVKRLHSAKHKLIILYRHLNTFQMLFSCKTKMPSFWALAQRATMWIPVCKLLQLPKLPEAWLTLSSSISMLQLISTLMPLRQQGPQLSFFSVVLLTPSSCHSSTQLWETMAQECAFWIRTYISDARHCAKSARAVFHDPHPWPQQWPGPPNPLHKHTNTHPTFSTSSWCLKNHYYETVTHPVHVFARWSRARVHRHLTAVIRLHRLSGTCQGAGVKWIVFKDQSWCLMPCQLHKRIY